MYAAIDILSPNSPCAAGILLFAASARVLTPSVGRALPYLSLGFIAVRLPLFGYRRLFVCVPTLNRSFFPYLPLFGWSSVWTYCCMVSPALVAAVWFCRCFGCRCLVAPLFGSIAVLIPAVWLPLFGYRCLVTSVWLHRCILTFVYLLLFDYPRRR